MGTLKIKGQTSGSVSLKAPDTGSDAILTLPGVTGELLPLSGGKILQIVRATDNTLRSTTSTSFVDVTGMSVTITPQKSDSAIMVIAMGLFNGQNTSTDTTRGQFAITDSSNNELSGAELQEYGSSGLTGTGTRQFRAAIFISAWTTPGVITSVTYKLRFRSFDANVETQVRNNQNVGQMFAIEVSA